MTLILIFFVLSALSVFCSAYFNKRWEETMPLGMFSIILIMYTFGLADMLKLGFYVVMAIVGCCYAAVIFKIAKSKSIKSFAGNTFTPAFVIFCILYAACIYVSVDTYPNHMDDFSHWAFR